MRHRVIGIILALGIVSALARAEAAEHGRTKSYAGEHAARVHRHHARRPAQRHARMQRYAAEHRARMHRHRARMKAHRKHH